MNPAEADLELNLVRFVKALSRHRRVFLAVAGVVIAAGVARVVLLTPVYDATAEILLDPSEELSMDTELQVAASNPLEDVVLESLGDDAAAVEALSASAPGGTTVLRFSARSAEPEVARRAADAFADAYADRRIGRERDELDQQADVVATSIAGLLTELSDLDGQLAALEATEDPLAPSVQFVALRTQREAAASRLVAQQEQQDELLRQAEVSDGDLDRLAPAETPTVPSAPLKVRDTLLAVILGIVLGGIAANARDLTDDRFRQPSEVATLLGLPILGVIPRDPSRSRRLVVLSNPDSADAEAFRAIRTAIATASSGDARIRSILVTSAIQGEGKTTIAANLAVAFSLDGRRVLCVDADLRRPALHEVFGCASSPGLSEMLSERREIGEALVSVPGMPAGGGPLQHVPAGALPPNPAELLGSTTFGVLADAMARINDIVVYDAPPLLPVTDAVLVSQRVDAVILVVSATEGRKKALRAVAELAARSKMPLLGVIVNGVETVDTVGYRSGPLRYTLSD